MTKVAVTGAAGFIGSHLVENLLSDGVEVLGLDSITSYYETTLKRKNLRFLENQDQFHMIEGDLLELDLRSIFHDWGVQQIFHLAAQPGVRASWGDDFSRYVSYNVLATQRLLEAAVSSSVKRVLYASSSSVYGDAESLPTSETVHPKPISPYGVTKLSGEYLCHAYRRNFALDVVWVRYFTVYGPRQRPDMAFHKFIKAMLSGEEIQLYGGGQTRDFTYVSDAVQGTRIVMDKGESGRVYNIGGGARISLNESLKVLESILGIEAKITRIEAQKGDVRHTSADISAAQAIGYNPSMSLENGLRQEAEWVRGLVSELSIDREP